MSLSVTAYPFPWGRGMLLLEPIPALSQGEGRVLPGQEHSVCVHKNANNVSGWCHFRVSGKRVKARVFDLKTDVFYMILKCSFAWMK